MKRLLTFVALLLALAVVAPNSAAQMVASQRPTITTDKPDYHPGETVTFTGKGFKPGEQVAITMAVNPVTHATVALVAVADDAGNFTNKSYVVQKSDLGVTFDVRAIGVSGDSAAPYTFTDSIGTPTSIGTKGVSATATTSLPITVSAAVPVNNSVIVTMVFQNTGTPTVTVTDTGGNTYTNDADIADSTPNRTIVFSAPVTTALTTSSTITVHFSVSEMYISATAFQVSGVLTASPVDKTSTASGTAASMSSGTTATTTQAGELLFGAFGGDNQGSAFTAGATYSPLTPLSEPFLGIYPEYRIVTATGAYAATGTLTTNDWAAAIVTFKDSASQLAFSTTPVTIIAGACSSQITVQSQDSNGSAANPNTTETIALGTSGVGGSFYSNSTCTTPITSVTIANTANSANFFWTDTTVGGPVVTATGTGAFSSAPTQTETVNAVTPETITATGVGTQTPSPVTAGSSATYAITTTWAGNAGTCTSNALGINWTAPTGATAFFGPTTVTNGATTSTLTISTTGATPAATTPFTVTASTTAGGACGTSSITSGANSLVVNAPRTITAVSVGTQTPNPVNPPNSATYTITATFAGNGTCTSNGLVFNGSLPSGSVASFSPTTVTNAVPTSTLTITTSGASSGSTTPFTVTASTSVGANNCGTSSSNSPSANFVINGNTILTNVVGTQTPTPVISGSSSTYSITTTWSGGAVCTSAPLSINWTAPTGATAVFGPTTVSSTSATSTLTISTTTATPAATTPFTVTAASTGGTGNCGTSSVTSSANSLVVTNRTITATAVGTQQTNPVISGGSSAYTITTTWAGAGTCTSAPLTINWTPAAGETAAFSPTTVTNAAVTSTLTISTTGSTPAGTTPFTVTAATTGGTGSCGTSSITSSSANFVVQTPAGITAVSVGAQAPTTVTPPASATYTVTATWTGGATCTSNALVFNGSLPTGSVASFSPTTVTTAAPTSTLTITSNGTTTPGGTTPFTVTASSTASGTCATGTATSSGSNYVVNPQTILTNVVGTQTPTPVGAGASATFSITTTWSGGAVCTSAPLTINWTAPTGATAVFGPTTVASNAATSTLTISTTTATPASTTPFTVTAASTGGTGNCGTSSVNSTSHNFVVTTETITATTVGTQTPTPVITGNSATFAISTTWTGAGTCTSIPLAINWSAPAGTTASFSPTTVTNSATTSTLTISTTNGTTPSGSTNFTVTAATTGGTGACGTSSIQSTTHAFVVQTPAVITSVTIGTQTPNPVAASLSATYSVTTTWTGTATCTPIVSVNWNPGVPTGVTTGFSPTITSAATTSTLTVTTAASTPAGTTPFTVTVTSTGGTGGAACGTGSITSAGSTLVVQAAGTGNFTQPFNTGHGWTYTQSTCTGSTCSNNNNVTVAADCQTQPCVSVTIAQSGFNNAAKTETGYWHNPIGTLTWQSLGVPANATVVAVKGSWYDIITQVGNGCDNSTDTTVGIHIYNNANSAEITSAAVFADTGVDSDTALTQHNTAPAVTVNSGSGASSTGINFRFDVNPATASNTFSGAPTCNIFTDSLNLVITYTTPNSGRRGQVIIGFTRTPDGNFKMSTPTYVASPLADADQRTDTNNSAIVSKREN